MEVSVILTTTAILMSRADARLTVCGKFSSRWKSGGRRPVAHVAKAFPGSSTDAASRPWLPAIPSPGHHPGCTVNGGPLRTPAPRELIHVDVKKLGRIPDGAAGAPTDVQ